MCEWGVGSGEGVRAEPPRPGWEDGRLTAHSARVTGGQGRAHPVGDLRERGGGGGEGGEGGEGEGGGGGGGGGGIDNSLVFDRYIVCTCNDGDVHKFSSNTRLCCHLSRYTCTHVRRDPLTFTLNFTLTN